MADFTFLFNRKGAIYPIDLSDTPPSAAACIDSGSTSVHGRAASSPSSSLAPPSSDWPFNTLCDVTLVHLCCKTIVSMKPAHIDLVVDALPVELFVPLFRASLYPVKDAAIEVLINKWPHRSLTVSSYISNMFSSMVVLFSDSEMGHRTRIGIKYSADIVHSFIDALRNRRTRLRYLDITGLPIAEIIIKYVATHCRLAQKEHQRNCLIDEYLRNVTDLEHLSDQSAQQRQHQQELMTLFAATSLGDKSEPSSINNNENTNPTPGETTNTTNLSSSSSLSPPPPPLPLQAMMTTNEISSSSSPPPLRRSELKKTTSLPDEPIVFKFDCMLQERATFDELIGALEATEFNSRFRLQIKKLDLLCLGKSNIIKLLEKLDKTHIEGLRLQYNSITEETIRDILPLLGQLRNLRALDLSCNLVDYRQNAQSARQMAHALTELTQLSRLDLSGSPLGGCLHVLLGAVCLPLQYLSLHSCGLAESDLIYLAGSAHAGVEHLDIGENRLARYSDALVMLLKRCAPTVCVLELDDNRFDCIDYLTVVCLARKMPHLKMLTTKGTFETNDHLLGAEFLHHSRSLRAWRISFPIDIYDPNETDVVAQDTQKRVFLDRMNSSIKDRFKLVVHELFN